LLDAGDVGDMVVLNPGEMPDQPGDRVGFAVESKDQLGSGQPVEGLHDDFADP